MIYGKKGKDITPGKINIWIYNWVLEIVYNVFPQFSWRQMDACIIKTCRRKYLKSFSKFYNEKKYHFWTLLNHSKIVHFPSFFNLIFNSLKSHRYLKICPEACTWIFTAASFIREEKFFNVHQLMDR